MGTMIEYLEDQIETLGLDAAAVVTEAVNRGAKIDYTSHGNVIAQNTRSADIVKSVLADMTRPATPARRTRSTDGWTDRYGDTHYRSRGYVHTADGAIIYDYA